MRRTLITLMTGCSLLAAGSAHAQATDVQIEPRWAVGGDVFYSTDADDTEVTKLGANLDWSWKGPQDYRGLRVETATFKPSGQSSRDAQRVYFRAADTSGDWTWMTNVGTDGDTVLGSASIHNNARYRQEYFIEREIVETPRGLDEGIYYTFVGGAFDIPISERSNLNLFVGAQDFTGDNLRTHLRATYVYVVKPEWGLSAQLRARYYHSSDPGEYDYFSPRDYTEIIPVLQVRRFYGGWRYKVAGGIGGQKATGRDWKQARYFDAEVISPPVRDWSFKAGLTYSNTPVASGYTYDYTQVNFGVTRAF